MSAASHAHEAADREGATVNDEIDAEYGFEPAVSSTGSDTSTTDRTASDASPTDSIAADATTDTTASPAAAAKRDKPNRPAKGRPGLRRRIGATVILLGALGSMGGAYAAFAASSGASDTVSSASDISAGRQIYQVSCITCHGANLEGVKEQGPALISVGSAAVYFQVSTGRMPASAQGAYEARKDARFNEKQTEQLAAYVESVGGGPALPQGALRGSDNTIAEGGALFRLNCASCHGTTFKGAPLSAGKIAPSLNDSNDKQMYSAMLSGPESMPVFSDNQLTSDDKRAIIAYVQTLKASKDPGGSGIDRIGPVSEAIVIWAAGVGALMVSILWIGARSK